MTSPYEQAVQAMRNELPQGPLDKSELAMLLDAALDVLGPEIVTLADPYTDEEGVVRCRDFAACLAALKESR